MNKICSISFITCLLLTYAVSDIETLLVPKVAADKDRKKRKENKEKVVRTSALYTGGSRFKSRPEDRLS
jgi:hypothetical protein